MQANIPSIPDGHSTCSLAAFIEILQSFGIRTLADIRRFPGSGKYPQFNKESLSASLKQSGIHYTHLEDLGGRRKVHTKDFDYKGYTHYATEAAVT